MKVRVKPGILARMRDDDRALHDAVKTGDPEVVAKELFQGHKAAQVCSSPEPCTLRSQTINRQLSTPNPQPSTLHPEPSTLNHDPKSPLNPPPPPPPTSNKK